MFAETLRRLSWAAAAARQEVFGFRFSFPVEFVVESTKPESLHYYVFSERLFREHLAFDSDGVVVRQYRAQGTQYNPVFVAWWALFSLERHLRGADPRALDEFHAQIRWLKANVVERPDGSAVWTYGFDWQEGRCHLRAPWISAMSQGLAVSALIRFFRLTGETAILGLCERAVRVFDIPVEGGGVRSEKGSNVLYEEYPGLPLPRVLDGFLFSLLGLYDVAVQLRQRDVWDLFEKGVAGLKANVSEWDYRGRWTWYGTHGYLCPPHYHRLNGTLMSVLGQLTDDPVLVEYGAKWTSEPGSVFQKCEIFTVFLISKNLARLRLPLN